MSQQQKVNLNKILIDCSFEKVVPVYCFWNPIPEQQMLPRKFRAITLVICKSFALDNDYGRIPSEELHHLFSVSAN